MSQEWYNLIALRNGGYKSDADYTIEGLSGEAEFESKLIKLLPLYQEVLDIGCGHGEFTLKMAAHAHRIEGVDNAIELLKIGRQLISEEDNIKFTYASTKGAFPLKAESYDLIYSRRGPTSIVDQAHILKSGGLMMGIHTHDLDMIEFSKRLKNNGFHHIEYTSYEEARYFYKSREDFISHISSMHCSLDYSLEEHAGPLEELILANQYEGRLSWPEKRYIWSAVKI